MSYQVGNWRGTIEDATASRGPCFALWLGRSVLLGILRPKCDSGARLCAVCNCDISARRANAITCGARCRKAMSR